MQFNNLPFLWAFSLLLSCPVIHNLLDINEINKGENVKVIGFVTENTLRPTAYSHSILTQHTHTAYSYSILIQHTHTLRPTAYSYSILIQHTHTAYSYSILTR